MRALGLLNADAILATNERLAAFASWRAHALHALWFHRMMHAGVHAILLDAANAELLVRVRALWDSQIFHVVGRVSLKRNFFQRNADRPSLFGH